MSNTTLQLRIIAKSTDKLAATLVSTVQSWATRTTFVGLCIIIIYNGHALTEGARTSLVHSAAYVGTT